MSKDIVIGRQITREEERRWKLEYTVNWNQTNNKNETYIMKQPRAQQWERGPSYW